MKPSTLRRANLCTAGVLAATALLAGGCPSARRGAGHAAAPAAGAGRRVADLSAFIREYLGKPARKQAFQFAVISDTHIGMRYGRWAHATAVRNLRALLNDIKATAEVDFVINTGDMTEGKPAEANELMAIFTEVLGPQARLIGVVGNHEGHGTPVLEGLYGIRCAGQAAACNYSFDYGRWHFVIVNNGLRDFLDPVNRRFMEADLAAHRDRPTLLFYHVHVYCPRRLQGLVAYRGERRRRALAFLDRFRQLRACFAGNDHTFWHCRHGGRRFFSTVGSWYPCGATRNGWWWVRADGRSIRAARKYVGKPPVDLPPFNGPAPAQPPAELPVPPPQAAPTRPPTARTGNLSPVPVDTTIRAAGARSSTG